MTDGRPEITERTMSEEERAEFYRRRRSRNLAMLAFLLTLVAIFFAISMVKVGSGDPPSRSVTEAPALPISAA